MCRRLAAVYGPGEAKAIVRLLLEEKFSMSLADILCGGAERLPADGVAWLATAMERLEKSEPVQYVLGWEWFCGHRFAVAEGVLIPRPETEWLVERACALAGDKEGRGLRLLDIGTGSGCIAVSLKKALPDAYVEAWDISQAALDIARDNAASLGAGVVFRQRDALHIPDLSDRWDIIVSNPPYICDSERKDMASNVLCHEPHTALFVPDDDPLLFYRAITEYACRSLQQGGRLLFECNTQYAEVVAQLMRDEGLSGIGVADDCFGKPRFVEGETV